MLTDLAQEDAGHVINRLEETFALLGHVIFGKAEVPSFQTTAVVFKQDSTLREFIGDGRAGIYTLQLPIDLEPSPTIVASGKVSPSTRLLFAHELTHRFNRVALGPMPIWLNEGLAEYYQAIRGEKGQPVVGEIDPRYMCEADGRGDLRCFDHLRLNVETLPAASALLRMNREAFYAATEQEHRALSWEQNQARLRNYGLARTRRSGQAPRKKRGASIRGVETRSEGSPRVSTKH